MPPRTRPGTTLFVLLYLLSMLTACAVTPKIAKAASQPDWMQSRIFDGGQVYLLPLETVRLEYHLRDDILADGTGIMTFQSSVTALARLPARLQLGLALGTQQNGVMGPLILEQETVSLDWAWARWQQWWGNPVLSGGFSRGQSLPPDAFLRITLSDAPWDVWRVYGAAQVSRQLSGYAHADQYQLRGGIGWQAETAALTVALDAGIGMQDQAGSRFIPSQWEVWVSPSLQWQALSRVYLMGVVGLAWIFDRTNGTTTSTWSIQPAVYAGYRF